MSIFCTIILTRGKNTGKMCGNACQQCHHVNKTCRGCNEQFNRDATYQLHIKSCKYYNTNNSSKIKPQVMLRKQTITESLPHMDRMLAVEKELNKLTRLLQVLPTTNIVNTTTNVVYQTINISDIGAFKTLCDKMGTNEATNFLCKLASKPQIMMLFEKVYLECDPSRYPIANNNGKDFMYRDVDNKIIHDEGGHKITQLSERLMKNTFIEAADPLLTRFVKHNEGDHEGDEDDYDKFRELQNGACETQVDKSFVKELYTKTYNPNHTFFAKNI